MSVFFYDRCYTLHKQKRSTNTMGELAKSYLFRFPVCLFGNLKSCKKTSLG